MNSNKIKCYLTILFIALFSLNANARPDYDDPWWCDHLDEFPEDKELPDCSGEDDDDNLFELSKKYIGEFRYYEGTSGYGTTIAEKKYIDPVMDNIESLYELKNELTQAIKTEVTNAINEHVSLGVFIVDLVGPITIKLTGLADGSVRIDLGGFSVKTFTSVSAPYLGSARALISVDDIWFSGSYNLLTGKIGPLIKENMEVNYTVAIQSNFDFLAAPLMNDLLHSQIKERIEDKVNTAIESMNQKLSGNENTLFGLNGILPDGKYVLDGLDVGTASKDVLTHLIHNQEIKVTLEEFRPSYGSVNVPGLNNTLYYCDYKHVVDIRLLDKFQIILRDKKRHGKRELCIN
jgi:hypothetical protein